MSIPSYPHTRTKDLLIILLILVAAILFSFWQVGFTAVPQEDAAMIMRYAQHFGEGKGIVWNIGEKPVDGATDFLFVIVDGLLYRTGLSIELSTRLLIYLAHLINVIVIFVTIPRTSAKTRIIATLGALSTALGPGFYYVSAYFATPFYALFASLTWFCGLKLLQDSENKLWGILFSFLGLMTGLIRPDGVILVMLMLLAIIYIVGIKPSLKLIRTFGAIFVVLGSAYFIWRWNYFGYPLPNPFYKKGGGILHYESGMMSFFYMLLFAAPVLPAFILGLRSKKEWRLSVGFFMILAGFTAAFLLISNEMNYRARFQYVILPISIMSGMYLIVNLDAFSIQPPKTGNRLASRLVYGLSTGLFVSFFLIYPFYINNLWGNITNGDGRYDVGLVLRDYQDRGFTIATSEAGLLPLYSRWKAVDTWGLNDQWIAHHKIITEDYLSEKQPEVIMIHFMGLAPQDSQNDWDVMNRVLKNYAEKNGYVLAASFGLDPADTHNYYIRTDFKESREIITRIRMIKYAWYAGGAQTHNFVADQ